MLFTKENSSCTYENLLEEVVVSMYKSRDWMRALRKYFYFLTRDHCDDIFWEAVSRIYGKLLHGKLKNSVSGTEEWWWKQYSLLRGLLYATVRNVGHEHFRKKRIAQKHALTVEINEQSRLTVDPRSSLLELLINGLPEFEEVAQTYYSGESVRAIAQRLGVSEPMVNRQKRRALLELKEKILPFIS